MHGSMWSVLKASFSVPELPLRAAFLPVPMQHPGRRSRLGVGHDEHLPGRLFWCRGRAGRTFESLGIQFEWLAIALGPGEILLGKDEIPLGRGAILLGKDEILLGKDEILLGRGAILLGKGEIHLGRVRSCLGG